MRVLTQPIGKDLDVLDTTFRTPDDFLPTEAINGRLEHLRGSALGFRNLIHYIARSLLETGGFRPNYTLPKMTGRTAERGCLIS